MPEASIIGGDVGRLLGESDSMSEVTASGGGDVERILEGGGEAEMVEDEC